MNFYDDLVAGKSFDGLLKEARQLDTKGEMALANVEKKERTENYENGLAVIIGQGLAPQSMKFFQILYEEFLILRACLMQEEIFLLF